jgi:hypothetical protein
MPGRWPRGSHPWVSWPTARPAGRSGKPSRASNLKSQPVAFGISRPTRTTTEESAPDSEVERPPTAGWTAALSRPGTAAGSHLPHDPTYAGRHQAPRARVPQHRGLGRGAAAGSPGRPAARVMARRSPPGIAAHSPPSGGGIGTGTTRLDARLSRPPPAAVDVVTRGRHPPPTTGPCRPPLRPLTRMEPANHELAHPTRTSPTGQTTLEQ